MSISVKISPKLKKSLETLPTTIMDQLKKELIETAFVDIETRAKVNARVDTGRLRSSLHVRYGMKNKTYRYSDDNGNSFTDSLREDPNDSLTKFSVIVGTGVNYALQIERKYPFLEPAFLQARAKLKLKIKAILKG